MATGTVKLLRLVTGEEIIAEVVETNASIALLDTTIRLKNPIRIVLIPDNNGKAAPKVGFASWYEFSKDEVVEIDRSHVMLVLNPIPQFVEHYKATFSNIIMPESSTILLPKK